MKKLIRSNFAHENILTVYLGGTFLCGIVSSGPAPPNCGVQAGKYVSVGYGTVNSFLNMKNGRYTPMERGESSVVAEFRDKSSYFFSVIFLLLLK